MSPVFGPNPCHYCNESYGNHSTECPIHPDKTAQAKAKKLEEAFHTFFSDLSGEYFSMHQAHTLCEALRKLLKTYGEV